MSIVFALGSAALYGLADFLGGILSRRGAAWPVALMACAGSATGALGLALVLGGDPTSSELGIAVIAGVGSGLGTAFLYRGLARGRMSVVAPVSAVGAALVPLFVGVVTGDRPTMIAWVGIVGAVPAIWLVASGEDGEQSSGSETGLLDGILAGLGFGLMFALLGSIPDDAGLWPLAAAQSAGVLALALLALTLRERVLPRRQEEFLAYGSGFIATAAVVLFLLATSTGLLSIAAIVASLYPAFTVLLAMAVLRERIHRIQGWGLALCVAAVVLVSLG